MQELVMKIIYRNKPSGLINKVYKVIQNIQIKDFNFKKYE